MAGALESSSAAETDVKVLDSDASSRQASEEADGRHAALSSVKVLVSDVDGVKEPVVDGRCSVEKQKTKTLMCAEDDVSREGLVNVEDKRVDDEQVTSSLCSSSDTDSMCVVTSAAVVPVQRPIN